MVINGPFGLSAGLPVAAPQQSVSAAHFPLLRWSPFDCGFSHLPPVAPWALTAAFLASISFSIYLSLVSRFDYYVLSAVLNASYFRPLHTSKALLSSFLNPSTTPS